MNSDQITERMEQLVDPTLVILGQFDEDELFEKCQMWENMRELTFSPMQHEIVTSVDHETLKVIADADANIPLLNSEKIESVVKTMVRTVEDTVHESIEETIWEHLHSYTYDPVREAVEVSVHNSVIDSTFIHEYSKFTPDEFSSILKPITDMQKERVISIHARFNDMDWFWKNGLCCFKGFVKGEYFVCSYSDPKFYRQIKGVVSFE